MAICPIHNKEMREGKFGPFCATKLDDGTWCKYKGEKSAYKTLPVQTQPAYRPNGRTQQDWDMIGIQKALCGMVNAQLSAGIQPGDINIQTLKTLWEKIEFLSEDLVKDNGVPF